MNATGECSRGGANLFLPLLLVVIMLTGNASAASHYDRQTGSDYSNNHYDDVEKFVDCSEFTTAGQYANSECDDQDSIILGVHNYDDGYNDAMFKFNFDMDYDCLYNDGNASLPHSFLGLRFQMDYQTNGPSHSGNDGWKNGYMYSYGGSQGTSSVNYAAANQLFAYVWDYENSNWDLINLNNRGKIAVPSGQSSNYNQGTIPSENYGEEFNQIYLDAPVDGVVPRTGREGVYVDDSVDDEIEIQFRLRNSPEEDDGYSTDLRTQIRNLNLSVRDEEVAPSNPSNTGYFSSVSGNPDFIYDYWTTTNGFNYETDDEAIDSCDQSPDVEYTILPLGVNPSSATSFSTSTDSKLNSDIYLGNTSGQFKLWYRAVDYNSNRASWIAADYILKLDLDGPNSGSVILTISQANNNWFNETHLPTFYWQGWNDSYSGVNYSGVNNYSVKVNSQNMGSSINHVDENTIHSWSMSSSDLSQLNLTCQTHDFTVVAYDKAQTVDSTGSPLQNPTPNSKEKKTTFNYDDCNPNPPELVSSETWYNSGNPNLEIVIGDDTNSSQSGINYCTFDIAGTNYTISATTCSDSSSNNAFSIPLSDGVHTGVFTACDLAGNCNSSDLLNDKRTVKVDTVAPADNNINIISPTPDSWTNSTSASATLTFEDPNPNSVTISGMDRVYSGFFKSNQPSPTVGDMENNSDFSDCSTNTCSITFNQTLSSGNWTLWYYAVDKAGNTLGPLAHDQFVLVDLAPPVASQPYFASSLTNESNLTLLWSAASDIHSGVSGYYVNLTSIDSNQIVSSRFVPTISTTISNLSDGNYSACIVPVDNVGNAGNSSCTSDYARIDTVNPIISAWSNVNGWTSNNTVVISWSASDDSQTAQVRYSRAGSWSQAFPVNDSRTLGNFGEGIHQIIVKANDSAGNVNQTTVTFGIDYSGPSVLISSNHGSSWTNQSTHIVSWNVTDMYSGVNMVELYVNGVLEQSNLSANDSYNVQFDSGQHNITLVTVDYVGNYHNSTIFAKVDLATPDIFCTVNPASWSITMPSVQYTISNNGSISNVDLTVEFNGNPIIPQNDIVTLPQSPDGIHSLVMRVENQGGNFDICSQDVYVDSTSPSFTAIPTIGDVVSQNDIQLNLSLQDIHSGLASVELLVDGIQYYYSTTEFDSTLINFSLLSQGTHQATINVVDNAGNLRSWNKSFIFDTVVPSIVDFQLVSPLNEGWLNQSNARFVYSVDDNLDSDPEVKILLNGNQIMNVQSNFTSELANGMNELQLIVEDHGGLSSSEILVVNMDDVVPSCTLESDIASGTWANVSTRTMTISTSSGSSDIEYDYNINGITQGTFTNNSIVEIPDGISQLTVTATSDSGLVGICNIEQRLDMTPDTIDLEIEESLGNYGNGIVDLGISSVITPQSPVSIRVFEGSDLLTSIYRDQSFNESFSFQFNESRRHLISVEVIDDAGNVYNVEDSVEIVIDTESPTAQCQLLTHNGDNVLEIDGAATEAIELLHETSKDAKIECQFEDENILNFASSEGYGSFNHLILNGVEISTSVIDIYDESFSLNLRMLEPYFRNYYIYHGAEISVSDMWGNELEFSLEYIFIDGRRDIDLTITTPSSEIVLPVANQPQQKLALTTHKAYEEVGCVAKLSVDGIQVVSSDLSECKEYKEFKIIDLLLDNNISIEPGGVIEIDFELTTELGPMLESSLELKFGSCADNYNFSSESRICVQDHYDGYHLSYKGIDLGVEVGPLARNRTNLDLDIDQPGKIPTTNCSAAYAEDYNGEEADYEIAGSNFTFKNINPDVTSINIICADGKFTEFFEVVVTWQKAPEIDDKRSADPDSISKYGVQIAIFVALAVMLTVLLMRKGKTASATLVPMNVQINQLLKEEE